MNPIGRRLYKDSKGSHIVEVDAAVVIGVPEGRQLAYIGEVKKSLTVEALDLARAKWDSIRCPHTLLFLAEVQSSLISTSGDHTA